VKRILLWTLLWLLILVAGLTPASRWPATSCLVMLAVSLYRFLGRKVEVRLRIGAGDEGVVTRVYSAMVWKRAAAIPESAPQCGSARIEMGATGRHR